MKINEIFEQNYNSNRIQMINALSLMNNPELSNCEKVLKDEMNKYYKYNKSKFLDNEYDKSDLIKQINKICIQNVAQYYNEQINNKFKNIRGSNSDNTGYALLKNPTNSVIYKNNVSTRNPKKTDEDTKIKQDDIDNFLLKREQEDMLLFGNSINTQHTENKINENKMNDNKINKINENNKIDNIKKVKKNINVDEYKKTINELININTELENKLEKIIKDYEIMEQKYNETKNIMNNKTEKINMTPYIFINLDEDEKESYLRTFKIDNKINIINNKILTNSKIIEIDSTNYCSEHNHNNYIIDITKYNIKELSKIEIIKVDMNKKIILSSKDKNNEFILIINNDEFIISFADNEYTIEEIIKIFNRYTQENKIKIIMGILDNRITFEGEIDYGLNFKNTTIGKIFGFTNTIYINSKQYTGEMRHVVSGDIYMYINNNEPKKINTYDNIINIKDKFTGELTIKLTDSPDIKRLINGYYPHKITLKCN